MEKKISSSKKCTDCKQELSLEAFPAQSKKCISCRYIVRRKAASATPQNFLTRSFGQLKHARIKKRKIKDRLGDNTRRCFTVMGSTKR